MNYFFISLAILFSTGLLLWQYAGQQPAAIPPQTQYLDWFGSDVVLTEVDDKGLVKQTLTTKTLRHYMPGDITDLTQVNLHLLPQEEYPDEWFLSGDKGRLFHADNRQEITRIDLWHNVELLRPSLEAGKTVTMETSTLAIFPEKEYAHTDQYTIVNQMGNVMSGMGMEVFFPTQQFHLINDVSSIHENAS